MSQFTPVIDSVGHGLITANRSAKLLTVEELQDVHPATSVETADVARILAEKIPQNRWSIGIDVAGRHQITVYFDDVPKIKNEPSAYMVRETSGQMRMTSEYDPYEVDHTEA